MRDRHTCFQPYSVGSCRCNLDSLAHTPHRGHRAGRHRDCCPAHSGGHGRTLDSCSGTLEGKPTYKQEERSAYVLEHHDSSLTLSVTAEGC